jgi:glycerol-3-phosphate acyltransferase PlsY
MKADKRTLIVPILLIALGLGWLLTTLGVAPGINWVWTLGLAVVGLLVFVVSGWDKFTAVVGPFFIATSCLSLLRQTGRLSVDVELPILIVVLGVLLLIARHPAIPIPKGITLPSDKNR